MLRQVQYRELAEELRRTAEFDSPVVTWETKVIYVYSYNQFGRGRESWPTVYVQSCMVNPPSKNQLQRAPISFAKSRYSVVHADAGSILKRTTGPTLTRI
jgi:hypothetical protein